MARALHLVDVDNLLGDPATDDEVEIGWTIRRTSTSPPSRRAITSSSPRRRSAGTCSLLDEARWAVARGEFDRVVIGSGDRIFLTALRCRARAFAFLPERVAA